MSKLILKRGALSELGHELQCHFPAGNVAVFGDARVSDIVSEAAGIFADSGFLVRELIIRGRTRADQYSEVLGLPEFIKCAVAVGCGRAFELARELSAAREIPYVLIASAPATDSFFISGEMPPLFILSDSDLNDAAPHALIASGTGAVFSKYIAYFDLKFNEYITGRPSPLADKILSLLDTFESIKTESGYPDILMRTLFELSKLSFEYDRERSSAEIFGSLVSDYFRIMRGEADFIAAYSLSSLYNSFLSVKAFDTLIPADKIKSRKLLQKKCGVNFSESVKTIDISPLKSYLKHTYIVNEYREDLRALAASFDMAAKQRFFRRLYDDAGFALKDKLTIKELLRLMSLSGEIAAGSFLGYLKSIGFLEAYI